MNKEKNKDRFSMAELHLVKADVDRTFVGAIKRDRETSNVFGSVVIEEGKIIATANSDKELTKKMDELCILKLDHNIHEETCQYTKLFSEVLYHN